MAGHIDQCKYDVPQLFLGILLVVVVDRLPELGEFFLDFVQDRVHVFPVEADPRDAPLHFFGPEERRQGVGNIVGKVFTMLLLPFFNGFPVFQDILR